MAQKCGTARKLDGNNTHPPALRSSWPAAQPIKQGNFRETAPTSTETERPFQWRVHVSINEPAYQRQFRRKQVEKYPGWTALLPMQQRQMSNPNFILPDTGRLKRFIRASVFLSTIHAIGTDGYQHAANEQQNDHTPVKSLFWEPAGNRSQPKTHNHKSRGWT